MAQLCSGEVIAIDGKVLRHSYDSVGIKAKRLKAGWDEHYLAKVLAE